MPPEWGTALCVFIVYGAATLIVFGFAQWAAGELHKIINGDDDDHFAF